jgi:hypothetical protein
MGEKFPKPSEKLIEMLSSVKKDEMAILKKMFGCPAYFINGNMSYGIFADKLFFRLDEKSRMGLMEKKIGGIFEPLKGRKMKEYIEIKGTNIKNEKMISELVAESEKYVKTIPVKIKKEKQPGKK